VDVDLKVADGSLDVFFEEVDVVEVEVGFLSAFGADMAAVVVGVCGVNLFAVTGVRMEFLLVCFVFEESVYGCDSDAWVFFLCV